VFNVCATAFPRFASVVGAGWILSRISYQHGYGTYGPKARAVGSRFSYLTSITLVFPSVNG
jgi:hypothetical protein